MEDLDAASVEDVHAFFRRFYGPNNTVLTLVGDLTPEEGFAAAERYFGAAPGLRRAGPGNLAEPLGPLTEPVRDERVEDVPDDRLHVAFRLPVDDTEEFFAASPRDRHPRRPGHLPAGTSGWSGASRSPTACRPMPWASSTGCRSGSSASTWPRAQAPTRSRRTLRGARCGSPSEGPTAVEMESALAQTERSWLSALASQEERADVICQPPDAARRPGFVNTYLDRLMAMTPEQVQAVADQWLRPHSRAVVAYLVATEEEAA